MCDVKTVNLLPAVLASKKAADNGCDEAVFVRDGIVTECAHSNIAIVKDGILYTHPLSPFILPGVTRKRLLYFCDKLKINYVEKGFSYGDMSDADEILVTSTTKLCLAAKKIDGIEIKNFKSEVGARLICALREDFTGC